MGSRTLLSIALTVLMLARAVIALVWVPFKWAQTRHEVYGFADDYAVWMDLMWHRHLLATAFEVLVAAFIVLRPRAAPAFLLPPPQPGRTRLRVWLEAGIALVAFDVALQAVEGVLLIAVLPFESVEFAVGGEGRANDMRGDLAVLVVAVLFLFLPRLGRVLSPARPAEVAS